MSINNIKVIKYYFSFKEVSQVELKSISEVVKIIEQSKQKQQSEKIEQWEKIPAYFEIFNGYDNVKIFMDIENYKDETNNTLVNLINDFIKYFNEETKNKYDISNYILTENENSRHPGRSFHLIFLNVCLNYRNLRNLIFNFVENHKIYKNIIDTSVYSNNRLFRLPYQHTVSGCAKGELTFNQIEEHTSKIWEKWFDTYYNNNFHSMTNMLGTIHFSSKQEDYIIQNVQDCKLIEEIFKNNTTFKPSGFSFGRKHINIIPANIVNAVNKINSDKINTNDKLIDKSIDIKIDIQPSKEHDIYVDVNSHIPEVKQNEQFKIVNITNQDDIIEPTEQTKQLESKQDKEDKQIDENKSSNLSVKTAIDGTSIPIYHDIEKICHEPEKIKPIGIKNGKKVIEEYKKDIEKINSNTKPTVNEFNKNISHVIDKSAEKDKQAQQTKISKITKDLSTNQTLDDKLNSILLSIRKQNEKLLEVKSKISRTIDDKIKMLLIQIKLMYETNKNIDEQTKIKLQIVENLINYYNSNNYSFNGFKLYNMILSNIDVLNFINENFKIKM